MGNTVGTDVISLKDETDIFIENVTQDIKSVYDTKISVLSMTDGETIREFKSKQRDAFHNIEDRILNLDKRMLKLSIDAEENAKSIQYLTSYMKSCIDGLEKLTFVIPPSGEVISCEPDKDLFNIYNRWEKYCREDATLKKEALLIYKNKLKVDIYVANSNLSLKRKKLESLKEEHVYRKDNYDRCTYSLIENINSEIRRISDEISDIKSKIEIANDRHDRLQRELSSTFVFDFIKKLKLKKEIKEVAVKIFNMKGEQEDLESQKIEVELSKDVRIGEIDKKLRTLENGIKITEREINDYSEQIRIDKKHLEQLEIEIEG